MVVNTRFDAVGCINFLVKNNMGYTLEKHTKQISFGGIFDTIYHSIKVRDITIIVLFETRFLLKNPYKNY